MDAQHPLKILLQFHLASDGNAVLHLPHTISALNADAFEPSSHLTKWTARINSLIHSKDAGARWAGLCIALRTSILSKSTMLECAQSWVTAALSLASKNESSPVLKACIRLLRHIFTAAAGVPEFQRQVSTPNVPKFSTTLISLAEKHDDMELKVLSLKTLSHLLPNYPTLHRALQSSLTSLSLRYLNGASPKPVPDALLAASSGLYAVLHHTGGRVGAAENWRKSVEDTLQFTWKAFSSLRTTYSTSGQVLPSVPEDPLISVPLHLDRLRAGITVMSDLLQTSNSRSVVVPMGAIVKLCISLLSCTSEAETEGSIDQGTRYLESSAVPQIQALGCVLVQNLAMCARQAVAPHLTQIYYCIACLLEQKLAAERRLAALNATAALLMYCPGLGDSQLPSRLLRAILPTLTILVTAQSEIQTETGANGNISVGSARSRKAKKRARGYEGDEVFNASRKILCPTQEDGDIVLASVDVTRQLLESSALSHSIQSLTGRILLAVFTALPHIPPSLISSDSALHGKLYALLQKAAVVFASGTASNTSKSLPLFMRSSSHTSRSSDVWRDIDLMLHPRAPPLVRALPYVESLSLFQAEESQEELETRRKMGIATLTESIQVAGAPMQDSASIVATIASPLPTIVPVPTLAPPGHTPSIASVQQPQVATASTPIALQATNTTLAAHPSPNDSAPALRQPQSNSSLPAAISSQEIHIEITSSSTAAAAAPSISAASTKVPVVQFVAMEEDENESMPGIDMDSDSD